MVVGTLAPSSIYSDSDCRYVLIVVFFQWYVAFLPFLQLSLIPEGQPTILDEFVVTQFYLHELPFEHDWDIKNIHGFLQQFESNTFCHLAPYFSKVNCQKATYWT